MKITKKIKNKVLDTIILNNDYLLDEVVNNIYNVVDQFSIDELKKLKKNYSEGKSKDEIKDDEFIKLLNYKITQKKKISDLYKNA